MPLDFPNTPATNDKYSAGGRTWTYNGTSWVLDVYVGVVPVGAVDTAQLANSAVTSAKIADGTIVNADISTSAAITATKITNWEDDQVVLSSQIFSA
jgi:hypothetical protein